MGGGRGKQNVMKMAQVKLKWDKKKKLKEIKEKTRAKKKKKDIEERLRGQVVGSIERWAIK